MPHPQGSKAPKAGFKPILERFAQCLSGLSASGPHGTRAVTSTAPCAPLEPPMETQHALEIAQDRRRETVAGRMDGSEAIVISPDQRRFSVTTSSCGGRGMPV